MKQDGTGLEWIAIGQKIKQKMIHKLDYRFLDEASSIKMLAMLQILLCVRVPVYF